jgi:hypothetical protein
MEVNIHPFLTWEPGGGECSVSHFVSFTAGKEPLMPLDRRFGGTEVRLDAMQKMIMREI